MFVGHFAVGFALKMAEPKLPLGALALTPVILWANWLDKKMGLKSLTL